MPQPTSSDLHLDTALTNVSVAWAQTADSFIARRAFPVVPVMKQSDKYWEYTRADWFRDEAQKRADATESAGSGYNVSSTATYFADVVALHKDIGNQSRANADAGFNLERDAALFVTQRLLLNAEIGFVNTFMSTGVWTSEDASTAGWSDYTNGDPIGDIEEGKQTVLSITGFEPNKLILSYSAYRAAKHHPDIVDRIKHTGGPGTDPIAAFASVVGVEEVLISKAITNTAKEGVTASYSFTASKDALLAYAPASAGLLTPSAGYTFVWNDIDQGFGSEGLRVRRIEMPHLGPAIRIEGEIAYDQKVVSADLGYYIPTASTF
jgi:hypothetical protein